VGIENPAASSASAIVEYSDAVKDEMTVAATVGLTDGGVYGLLVVLDGLAGDDVRPVPQTRDILTIPSMPKVRINDRCFITSIVGREVLRGQGSAVGRSATGERRVYSRDSRVTSGQER
jgi:hypothetical protein